MAQSTSSLCWKRKSRGEGVDPKKSNEDCTKKDRRKALKSSWYVPYSINLCLIYNILLSFSSSSFDRSGSSRLINSPVFVIFSTTYSTFLIDLILSSFSFDFVSFPSISSFFRLSSWNVETFFCFAAVFNCSGSLFFDE